MAEGEQARIGVIDLYINAASKGFLDNDPRIRIEFRLRPRPEEQRLIDAVLALYRKGREVAKTQLGVKAFRLSVVMQNGREHCGSTARHHRLLPFSGSLNAL